MDGKVTYHQQVSYCGKPRCRRCREGIGHGPYWYAYKVVNGRTIRTYIGKVLPPDIQASLDGVHESPIPPTTTSDLKIATVRIYTLGQFRLERRDGPDWQTVTDAAWQHQRVRSLLGCLLSSPRRKLGREQLMDAIWPELDVETAAGRLDRAVYSLRQLFEPERNRLATSPLLLTEREVLVLADQSQVWIDADAFERLLNQARNTDDPGEKKRLLEEASTLYGGDFLPEERKIEFTIVRREFLQRNWIGLLLELADLRAVHNLNTAIDPLDRILAIDPTNEAAVQRLIKLLAQLERRGEALRVYKRLAAILQQEYHIAPLPETRALYDAVRMGVQERKRDTVVPANRDSGATGSQDDYKDSAPALLIGRTHQSPLVGRDQEFSLLQGLLLATEHTTKFKLPGQKKVPALPLDTRRSPQSVLLMGEVGIGKTRLAEEMAREARRRGWAVAWSRVYPQEVSIPYRLWAEVLRKAMNQVTWQRQEVSKRPLIYQPLTALLPELDSLLTQVAMPSSQSPEQEQLRLWEATCELLMVISEGSPLLIVLDDVQWADRSSCELFAYLARRLYGLPMVIIGTCRENELGSSHPLRLLLTDLQREHAVETVQLQPLSDEQIGAIVSHVPYLTEPAVQYIQTRAAGNPFFAEELARTVGTSSTGGPSIAPNHLGDIIPALPDTIAAALNLRLSRLSSACQRLLSKAAALGSSFEFNLISAMEANTPGSNEDMVLDLVEEAMQSGMLTEEGAGTRITYQFWHPLLVTHLYENISAARRASFHRRAAEILRQEYHGREEEGAATITHHLVTGGAPSQQIAHYAELAGNRAYNLSAYPDAERYYRIAVEHLESGARQSSGANTDEQAHVASLLEFLGECTRLQVKYEEARHIYEQALEMSEQQRSLPSSAVAQIQAMLWCEVGFTWYDVGNNVQASQCYQQGERVLQNAHITEGPAWATICLQKSYVNWREGDYEKGRQNAQEALQLFERVLAQQGQGLERLPHSTRIRRILAGSPVELGRTHALLGLIATSAGQSTEATNRWNSALATFEQYDCQREIAVVCCNLGDVHLRRAEYNQAQAFLRRSLGIAERIGELPLVCIVFGNMGVQAMRTGDLAEAENRFKQGLSLAEQINEPVHISLLYTYLSLVLQDQGKLEETGKCLLKALSISRSMAIAPCIGFALIVLGSMRLAQAMMIDVEMESRVGAREEMTSMLKRAKRTLRRALLLEGMEAETRAEGQLALAQADLLLGEVETAQQQALQTLEEAHRYELTWLIARAQRILGSIFTVQGQREQAELHFEQALHTVRKSGMRLEYAHTLRYYGLMLLQQDGVDEEAYGERGRGLNFLREARQVFTDCKAVLDVRMVEDILARHEQAAEK